MNRSTQRLRIMSGSFVTQMAIAATRICKMHPTPTQDPAVLGFITVDDMRDHAAACNVEPSHPGVWHHIFDHAPAGYEFRETGAVTVSRYSHDGDAMIPIYVVVSTKKHRFSA